MKKVITLLLFSISFFGFSQDVKLKKEVISVDDTPWLKYKSCGNFDEVCSIYNNQNEELIFINSKHDDTKSDPNAYYFEVVFIGQKVKIELEDDSFKKIIKILYNSNVVSSDGTLSREKIDRLVEKYGTPYSDKANKVNNNPNTIIINNNQQPQRSGVNINIGR